jgi:hypothetical protein
VRAIRESRHLAAPGFLNAVERVPWLDHSAGRTGWHAVAIAAGTVSAD